jgi:hypothetical protein
VTQSNVIAGALLGGFLVFITTRGELPEYIRLFTKKRETQGSSDGKGDGGSFFGIDVPFINKKTEKNAEDKAIDAVGNYFGGEYYQAADKFI